MSENQKDTRTQITDLPEIDAELSEDDMRIVAGGLYERTNKITGSALACVEGGDWDTDYSNFSFQSGGLTSTLI